MAQRVQVFLIDDIDQSPAEEKVEFALDGTSYEIDLSASNAAALRDALAPYVGAARATGGRRARPKASARGNAGASEMRAWAAANGFEVSARGRVPSNVKLAFEAAQR